MSKTTHEIPDDVLDVLERSTITATDLSLPEQLDPKLYQKVKKVITLAGGVWLKKEATHRFKSDPRALLGMAIQEGKIFDKKKAFQQFNTPREVAELALGNLDVTSMVVLDPSAGGGMLLDVAKAKGAWTTVGYDIDPEAEFKEHHAFRICDFLTIVGEHEFDLVFMNPPFQGNRDCLHVTHAFDFVKPGGHIIAIMYPNEDRKAFTKLLQDPRIEEFNTTPVPAGAFSESGTEIQTIIVRIRTTRTEESTMPKKKPMTDTEFNEHHQTKRIDTPPLAAVEACLPEKCNREIPLDCLSESPFQKRTDYGDLEAFAASIKERGILQPLLIRAFEKAADGYEIIAGHRRARAAKLAGLKSVPCRLMEANDLQAEELVLIDNAMRKDLNLLELTDTIAQLAKATGLGIVDLATRLSLPVASVRQAMAMSTAGRKLMKLYSDSQKDGAQFGHWSAVMWADLARLPEATQDDLIANYGMQHKTSLKDLREFLAGHMREISSIRWDFTDATFKCGRACTGCPFRSDYQKELFPELNIVKKKADARCLDEKCFEAKTEEHALRVVEKAKADLGVDKIPVVTTGHKDIAGSKHIAPYDLEHMANKKQTPGSKPILNIDTGEILYMKPPKVEEGKKAKEDMTPEEKKEAKEDLRECRRWNWVTNRMGDMLMGREGMKVECPKDWDISVLVYGIASVGGQVHHAGEAPPLADFQSSLTKEPMRLASDDRAKRLVDAFKIACAQAISTRTAGEANWKRLQWVAAWWGISLDALFEQAKEQIPDPKTK